ncbi:MAG TPA: hydrogenase expression/formation protein HypE [Pirellulaceae bacterium]|nr:hydrogenase expression/formation protein HypE [Planctomycetales bacterium]MCB9936654.1 hydrogenase expression/formation protein HypE [Planctomycetaceae bacterium]HRX77866.1 hydrogenase expression/formation protein HypE [Pirellulaceae bacterium]
MNDEPSLSCPLPDDGRDGEISLAHGEGGRLTRELLRDLLAPLQNEHLVSLPDGATLTASSEQLVFTTDSYVVTPLFFPGGDIGSLAVFGTANDLAVSGARPRWLSLSLIIEERFSKRELARIVASIAQAALTTNVQIVTGDTKVVPRGAADRLFINTAGIGELTLPTPGPGKLEEGDRILVTGPIGQHGLAVLIAREGLGLDPVPVSDSASLWPAVDALRDAGIQVKAMRDATRGGVAAVLHEWADACSQTLVLEAEAIPIRPTCRGACELLGLDPLHIACEGTMVVAVADKEADKALRVLRDVAVSHSAVEIGSVVERRIAPVAIRRSLGQLVPLDEPTGAPLPRIC